MAQTQDIFALVGKRMRAAPRPRDPVATYDQPRIANLIRRIDRALLERRAP
ncbi:hypothetical protein [Sphingomonas faeni]|uniref:hypothetical protein n=1 Tax=Sphingomonas faeni TaxID=185950 RepID=UPI00334DFA12